MVDNGIDGNRRLTGLSVTDNQLTLSSSDRNHRINSLDTGLHRRINAFSRNNTGCHSFNLAIFCSRDRTFAVNRLTKSIDYATKHRVAYGNLHNAVRRLYGIAFIDVLGTTKQYGADVVLLKVHDHAVNLTGELKKLALHCLFQSMYTCNTICHLNNRTDFRYFQISGISLNLILNHRTNFFWS